MPDIPKESVAIIGMAIRFPGAKSPDQFWRNLRDGVESISEFSDETLLAEGVPSSLLSDARYIKAAGALDDIDLFDASLFNMSPTEVEMMDPQQRLFLECAFESLENAGYCSDNGKWRIGVFGGVGLNRYLLHNFDRRLLYAGSMLKVGTGNEKDYLTTRVSYKLGLTGPSICTQTACSTSLVAVHLACRSLLDYQSDIALAGAVSLRLPQRSGYFFEEGGIVSPDGRCRAFAAAAAGTVFSSGAGIVVLKRLEDAIEDGDTIHAVIRGSAVNNDGAVKVGFTAPSIEAQAEVIAEALAVSEVDARSISYLEAHGTGTVLGDPIEISALTKAFRGWTNDTQFCPIGSVKTNIGHLDTAAGVAGLVKTVLALKHKQIPPSLNFDEPNPRLNLADSPFYVNTTLKQWSANGSPRRAGVSSFGVGGTNCHVIVEEAPSVKPVPQSARRFHLIPLSAKSERALDDMAAALGEHLSNNKGVDIADVAFTYQVGRKTLPHRRIVVASGLDDAVTALKGAASRQVFSSVEESVSRPVAFLFPGQGSQFAQMGSALYEAEPVFKKNIDEAAEVLAPIINLDLREILFPTAAQQRDLSYTSILQPALFAVEYSIAKMWMSWGVTPQAMIGHSIGEYVAACVAGVMSFEDGLALVARRGELIGKLPAGSMLSVPLKEADLQHLLGKNLAIATINAEDRVTVSGPTEEITELERRLSEEGIASTRLQVSHAFHSSMMDPILEEFRAIVGKLRMHEPTIPYVSNVTGAWISAREATDAGYWVRHLRGTVRFYDGLLALTRDPEVALLETGPGRVLSSLAKYVFKKAAWPKLFTSLPGGEHGGEEAHIRRTLGQLWLTGVPVSWGDFQKGQFRSRLPLPGYAFKRQRYWLTAPKQADEEYGERESPESGRGLQLYIPSWQRAPNVSSEIDQSQSHQPVRLVVYDGTEISAEITKRLRRDDDRTITVLVGDEFRQHDQSTYVIKAGEPQDYLRLMFDLAGSNRTPDEVVHLLNLEPGSGAGGKDALVRSFYSLLWLARAIEKYVHDKPVRITVISSNAHSIHGNETLDAEKAMIAGAFAVVPQEYPNITCHWVDTELAETAPAEVNRVLSELTNEIASGLSDSPVAYRRGQRFIRRFAGLQLPPEISERGGLRDNGAYLITGGFGGVGTAVARYLAREVRPALILVGRTALPDRAQWDTLLKQLPDEDETAKRIRTVMELESLGARVLAVAADVTDEAQMRAAVKLAEDRFGRIHGVIHAAGVAGGHLIRSADPALSESVLAPKVSGARILLNQFNDHRLDFLVLCSSLSSVLGGPGQSEYVAANAFMDAFAHHVNLKGNQPCVSINWDSWKEIGMAKDAAFPSALARALNLTPTAAMADGLSSDTAAPLLVRLAIASFPQVLVCHGSLHSRMRETATRLNLDATRADTLDRADAPSHPRPDLFTPYVPPSTPMEQTIAEVWQEALGLDRVGIDDSVFELGGDSLTAIRVSQKLSERLGIELQPVRIFTASSVRTLAAALAPQEEPPADLTDRQSRGARRRSKRLSL